MVAAAGLAFAAGALSAGPVAAAGSTARGVSTSGATCLQANPPSRPAPARLRFGVDPGPAGNLTPAGVGPAPKPLSRRKDIAAVAGLRSRHPMVVRLNRLFWSGGDRLLRRFARAARAFARAGDDVEIQVRYHPTSAETGDIARWVRWVTHVTDVLARNRRLTGLTVTNEVNFPVSPNTSDGVYRGAGQALVRGVEAAHAALHRHGWAHRVAVGFTFAYRFAPATDDQFWQLLRAAGPRFRQALGFVGLDDYPGTVYPPALPPGDTAGHELAVAVATLRQCFLPQAGIDRATPIWVTENGFSSAAPAHSPAKQRQQLISMITALHRIAGSEHVTDYRWFTLRDNDSSGSGTFDQDGLLSDDYHRKPSYSAFRRLASRFGR